MVLSTTSSPTKEARSSTLLSDLSPSAAYPCGACALLILLGCACFRSLFNLRFNYILFFPGLLSPQLTIISVKSAHFVRKAL